MFKFLKNLFKPEIKYIPAPPSEALEIKEEKLPLPHERRVHLGIIVGHTKKDGGAQMVETGENEYEYGKKVLNAILKKAESFSGLEVSGILRDDIGIRGAYDQARSIGCDAVVELHFNAANGSASGSLTLCTPDKNDLDFSHEIHNHICKAFNRVGTSRGVMVIGKTTRGSACIYAFPDGVNCLVEPFFGDNKADAKLGREKIEAYAQAICQGTFNWAIKNDLISPKLQQR